MIQWVLVNGMGLSSLVGVLLGFTALMRANSPKHPSECLQFAKIDVIQREHYYTRRWSLMCVTESLHIV